MTPMSLLMFIQASVVGIALTSSLGSGMSLAFSCVALPHYQHPEDHAPLKEPLSKEKGSWFGKEKWNLNHYWRNSY